MKQSEKKSGKKPVKKSDSKPKAKKKKPVKETTTPSVPVSDANSGYIPFGG